MVDDFPHIVIGGSLGLEHSPVLIGNVADAAVDGAAVEGDLVASGIFQNDVGAHCDVILALVKTEANQNVGVLDQILSACEHRIGNTLLVGIIGAGEVTTQNQRIALRDLVGKAQSRAVFQQLKTCQTLAGESGLVGLGQGGDHADTLLAGDTDGSAGIL